MINLFLIVSAIIGAILILIILFQKTEGGSLGLGTQTSLTGGMTSNKSSFTGMTKITYALGFGFLFWCYSWVRLLQNNFLFQMILKMLLKRSSLMNL